MSGRQDVGYYWPRYSEYSSTAASNWPRHDEEQYSQQQQRHQQAPRADSRRYPTNYNPTHSRQIAWSAAYPTPANPSYNNHSQYRDGSNVSQYRDSANSNYPAAHTFNQQGQQPKWKQNKYPQKRRLDNTELSAQVQSEGSSNIPKGKKKKPLSQNVPTKREWSLEDAKMAIKVEMDFSKRLKQNSLMIKFPDIEINKEIVSKFNDSIEMVHFQQPSTPRYCFVTLKEKSDGDAVIKALNDTPFGQGHLIAEYKRERENQQISPEDIDPLTLYVGNLAQEITKQDLEKIYTKKKRIDIGFAMKMKKTRYAFISFWNITDSIEAYTRTRSDVLYSKSLIVRFRRLHGTVGMPGEPKQQNPPRNIKENTEDNNSSGDELSMPTHRPEYVEEDTNPFDTTIQVSDLNNSVSKSPLKLSAPEPTDKTTNIPTEITENTDLDDSQNIRNNFNEIIIDSDNNTDNVDNVISTTVAPTSITNTITSTTTNTSTTKDNIDNIDLSLVKQEVPESNEMDTCDVERESYPERASIDAIPETGSQEDIKPSSDSLFPEYLARMVTSHHDPIKEEVLLSDDRAEDGSSVSKCNNGSLTDKGDNDHLDDFLALEMSMVSSVVDFNTIFKSMQSKPGS